VAGVVSFFLGSLMLFESDSPEMRLSWQVLLPTLTLVSGFFIVVSGLVFKTQVSKPMTGAMGLVGEIGVVKKALTPYGKVFVHGELWNATAKSSIEEGSRVKVLSVEGLVVEVEAVD